MAFGTTQVVSMADSIATAIAAVNTNFVAGTSAAAAAINTGVAGTGGSATVGRVLAYTDLASELALLAQVNKTAANVAADLSGRRSLTAFYPQYYPLLDALDSLVGGLNAYLTTNTQVVNAYFAAAFNAYCAAAVNLQYRTTANAPVALVAANYFPYASIDSMWNFTSSGATTFSVNAVGTNASSAVSGGGVAPFFIYKVNSGNAAANSAIVITYTNGAGNSASVTYNFVASTSPTGSGSLAAGFAISATGSAITGVTGSGMTAGEQYTIGLPIFRVSSY